MTRIPAQLRRLVIDRAEYHCEYCRLYQRDVFLSFEVDHITSEKHGGATDAANLALACPDCNVFKGSDIAGRDPDSGQATFLYNPRTQRWTAHFQLNGAQIEPLTAEGRITVFLLRLNTPERLRDRQLLIDAGLYP